MGQSINSLPIYVSPKYNSQFKSLEPNWTTEKASGSCAYVFSRLQTKCNLQFNEGSNLHFAGKGIVLGVGATGILGGTASFNVDPKSLIDAADISFEASGFGALGGGFQITWFKADKFIGYGEFYGLGAHLATPGGGWGKFTQGQTA